VGLFGRALEVVGKSLGLEGQYRPGPYHLPVTGGYLSAEAGQYWNWWQMGYDVDRGGGSAIVEACVSAYAQTIAMCPGTHKRTKQGGGDEIVTTSALSRILRQPNENQTRSDFLLMLVRSLLLHGNAYAIAERNDRFEVSGLQLMPPQGATVRQEPRSRAIFYEFPNSLIGEPSSIVYPARNVLHVKINAAPAELVGTTPLYAAAAELAARGAMTRQMATFFHNMSRPSGVLQTDEKLSQEQASILREQWNDHSKGFNSGKVPVLSWGLKWTPLSVTAHDAEIIEAMKLTNRDIAMAFRVPLAMVNDMTGANYSNTEQMMQWWLASGLGFYIDHIENAFDKFFGLTNGDYTEFDTSTLLRSAFKDRIEGLARGVQGGIYAPNEARALEGLAPAEDGDEPRVQQQVVPLSAWSKPPPAAPAPKAPEPAASADGGAGDKPTTATKKMDEEQQRLMQEGAIAVFAKRQREVVFRAV
jgi:HK97 family phage portal protein